MNPDIIGEALGIAGTIASLIGDAVKNSEASDLAVAQQLEQLLVDGAAKFGALRSQLQADDAKIDEQVKEELAAAGNGGGGAGAVFIPATAPKPVDAGVMPLAVDPPSTEPTDPDPAMALPPVDPGDAVPPLGAIK